MWANIYFEYNLFPMDFVKRMGAQWDGAGVLSEPTIEVFLEEHLQLEQTCG